RRHTRFDCDWSSDVCSSDLGGFVAELNPRMKNGIVDNGLGRFLKAKQKAKTSGSIYEKYAAELALASPDEKKKLQERMQREMSEIGRASCREREEITEGDG